MINPVNTVSAKDWPQSWLVPDWPVPATVHAVCTSREGGSSQGPWQGLNLGVHVGDSPEVVQSNRALLAQTIGAQPVFMEQVHGCGVMELDAAASTHVGPFVADACVTRQAGMACTVMVADCLPLLFAHADGSVVGAVHAGWRGLAGQGGHGVVESFWDRFCDLVQAEREKVASQTLVWMGPCIGAHAFEVGAEVKAAFVQTDAEAASLFRPGVSGRWWADLQGLARRRLQALGLTRIYGNDGTDAWCTVRNPSRFFSFRRDQALLGGSGRFAASIWIGNT